jgi:hypothetical protein
MKFIVFSDQHLGSKLYNCPELENDNRRLFSMVIDQCIKLQPDYLVSVGDLFDNNKPGSDLISFVSDEIKRLEEHSPTRAVALAGDHSKPVDGYTWERICGFAPISSVPAFVGVDYLDNPENVKELLNLALREKPKDSVGFIFMHQQLPELWPFCEDKKKISLKDLDFSNHCNSLKAIFLGDIHIRYQMKYVDPICLREVFAGYCGSLGVTASNETEKPGLFYWENDKLQIIPYELPRKFITIDIDKQTVEKLTENEATYRDNFIKLYGSEVEKPVFICKYASETSQELDKFNFLYDLGIVKFSRARALENTQEEMINIRSELKTAERISEVLKALSAGHDNSKLVYDTAYSLITAAEPATVLDQLKQTLIETT